jgi:thymidylate synthase (FAD)
MASACIEIVSTRDIVRQLLRHRSFSFQEFSQRYADPTAIGTGLEFQIREARWQDLKNRQNSIRPEEDDIEKKYIALQWERKQRELIEWVDEQYKWAIENGIAKEQARVILPEGLTSSRVYVNGTIRSWIHYIDVRSEAATQLEHRLIAQECARAIAQIFPGIEEYNHKD